MPPIFAIIAEVAPLIEKYGAPLLASIIGIFSRSTAPTQAEWDALLKQTSTTARDQMLATLAAHGIDPNSDAGKALLALT